MVQAARLASDEWARRGIVAQPEAFSALLDQVRATGLAHDLDEHTDGISAVGAAFTDRAGEIHAISVPIPSTRFAARRGDVEQAVTVAVARIRQLLHGT